MPIKSCVVQQQVNDTTTIRELLPRDGCPQGLFTRVQLYAKVPPRLRFKSQ